MLAERQILWIWCPKRTDGASPMNVIFPGMDPYTWRIPSSGRGCTAEWLVRDRIDYLLPCAPPLGPDDQIWADQLIKQAGIVAKS
jgi:hypothetical protein